MMCSRVASPAVLFVLARSLARSLLARPLALSLAMSPAWVVLAQESRVLPCDLDWSPGCEQAECDPDECVVAIDVGHDPVRGGATSARGRPEYEFNFRIAEELWLTMTETVGLRPVVINEDGEPIRLGDRARLATEISADLLVSIHHDSVQPQYLQTWTHDEQQGRYCDEFQGYSLFVSNSNGAYDESVELAMEVGRRLLARDLAPTLHHAEPIDGENRPLLDARLGVYRIDGLGVLRRLSVPAILLECGVLVNRQEELLLDDPDHRAKIVQAVTEAVSVSCARLLDH
jgi:N-acetylmuramoyl-L-alanine amidase